MRFSITDAEQLPPDLRSAAGDDEAAGWQACKLVGDADGPRTAYFLYLPRQRRGAVCVGGPSEWTDADSLDDLMDRWANYDARWAD